MATGSGTLNKGSHLRATPTLGTDSDSGAADITDQRQYSPDGTNSSNIAGAPFIAGGDEIATSSDSVTWTTQADPLLSSGINALAYGHGLVVAGGGSADTGGSLATSPDGTTWTLRSASWSPEQINAIIYAKGLFVAAASGGYLATSTDGITWTLQVHGLSGIFSFYDLNSLLYANGQYVVGGNNGTIGTSPDGINWTLQNSGFGPGGLSDYVRGLAYGNGLYVAVGDGGVIRTSPDAITWTGRTSAFGSGDTINAVMYDRGLFVAVGAAGKIITSPDGITWTLQTSGTGSILRSVSYGDGEFIAGDTSGTVYTSPDAVTWTPHTTGLADIGALAVKVSRPTLSVSNDAHATRGQHIALSRLVRISDPGNVGYTQLELFDSKGTVGGGHFVVNGVAQTGGHEIDVSPANVANTVFDAGTRGGTDTLWARLLQNNGQLSAWQRFLVTAPASASASPTASNDPTAARGQLTGGQQLSVTADSDRADIALLTSYLASTFVTPGGGYGGTSNVDSLAATARQDSLLVQPQHA
jgi:hypothetical protein